MKMSKRYMEKVLHLVEDRCCGGRPWRGATLTDFCADVRNRAALERLQDINAVNLVQADDDSIFAVRLLKDGRLYFLEKAERRKARILGFIVGIISGVLVSVITKMVLRCFGLS